MDLAFFTQVDDGGLLELVVIHPFCPLLQSAQRRLHLFPNLDTSHPSLPKDIPPSPVVATAA